MLDAKFQDTLLDATNTSKHISPGHKQKKNCHEHVQNQISNKVRRQTPGFAELQTADKQRWVSNALMKQYYVYPARRQCNEG